MVMRSKRGFTVRCLNPFRYIPTPHRCTSCHRQLRNKKRYYMLPNVITVGSKGYYTFGKVCRRCGMVNVARVDETGA